MTARRPLWPFAGSIVLFLALVAASWIGFIGSDDVTYARGAYGWLKHFPYVGGHGTIRYTITLPMAAAFRLIGQNEYAMVLPSLLYLLGFLVLGTDRVRTVCGEDAGLAALLLLATSPLFVIQASIANVDVVELFFLFASFALFWRALSNGGQPRTLIASGAAAGFAFLTRETAAFAAVFFGLLFLIGYGFHRLRYLWIGVGFAAIWAIELIYLGIMTGDPLYRFNISMHHDATIDRSIDLAGNVIVNPLIDPLLVILINQEFMGLFFIAIPVTVWLCFGRGIDPVRQRFVRLLALFGLTWFVCVGAAQHLLPLNPRYFMVTAAMAMMVTGIGIATLWPRRRMLAGGLMTLLVATNLVGIGVENKQPMFAERTLAAFARAHPDQRITTDPMTRYRADLLLRWAGAEGRVIAMPPARGALHLYVPANADLPNARMNGSDALLYGHQRNWFTVAHVEPPVPLLARGLEQTGLARLVPGPVWRKLRPVNGGVTFVMPGLPPNPSTMAQNAVTTEVYVAASPIPALPVFAQSPALAGRKGRRL